MDRLYKDMPTDFQEAVETIKQYCQFDGCDCDNCKECDKPLAVIRCGDKED